MKTRSIFAATLAAVTLLASCAKDNEGGKNQTEGRDAKLNISIAADTRASGTTPADGSTINNFTAFVFDAGGNLEGKKTSSDGSNLTGTDAIQVSTNAKRVYVVANVPTTGTWANDLQNVTSKSALEAVIADLNATGAGSQMESTGRFATGATTSDLTFNQSGNEFTATTTVDIKFVAARIIVKIAAGIGSDMETYYDADAGNDGSLKLTNVAVLNAMGSSKLFGTSLVPPTKKYYSGIDKGTGFVYWPASGNYTVQGTLMKDAITGTSATALAAEEFYYYVFENDATTAATFPTIVTLVGEYDGETIYFPVHLASYENFATGSDPVTSVTRGKSYEITITLTGDPRYSEGGDYPGETGGTEEPTNPVVKAKVSVSVRLTDWDAITLGKEF